jgi:DnaK suppressor protein
MNIEKYRERLLAKEQELLNNLQRTVAGRRERLEIVGIDPGDQSVFSEQKESMFAESHRHTTLLNKVRQALKRIEEGTYGHCIEDGETIAAARLHVVPWTAYCLQHQAEQDQQQETHRVDT